MYPAHLLGDELAAYSECVHLPSFPVADASQLGTPPVPDMAFTDAELRALLNISHQVMHIHCIVLDLYTMAYTLLGIGVLRPGELNCRRACCGVVADENMYHECRAHVPIARSAFPSCFLMS